MNSGQNRNNNYSEALESDVKQEGKTLEVYELGKEGAPLYLFFSYGSCLNPTVDGAQAGGGSLVGRRGQRLEFRIAIHLET